MNKDIRTIVPSEYHQRIMHKTREDGISISELVRQCMDKYLEGEFIVTPAQVQIKGNHRPTGTEARP